MIPQMRTGNPIIGEQNNIIDEVTLNFITVFTLFTEDALKIVQKYSLHNGRNDISGMDMSLALKVRFKHRSYFELQPDVIMRLESIKEELLNGDEIDLTELTSLETSVETITQPMLGNCNCDICNMFLDTKENWESYLSENSSNFSPLDNNLIQAIAKADEKAMEFN